MDVAQISARSKHESLNADKNPSPARIALKIQCDFAAGASLYCQREFLISRLLIGHAWVTPCQARPKMMRVGRRMSNPMVRALPIIRSNNSRGSVLKVGSLT